MQLHGRKAEVLGDFRVLHCKNVNKELLDEGKGMMVEVERQRCTGAGIHECSVTHIREHIRCT